MEKKHEHHTSHQAAHSHRAPEKDVPPTAKGDLSGDAPDGTKITPAEQAEMAREVEAILGGEGGGDDAVAGANRLSPAGADEGIGQSEGESSDELATEMGADSEDEDEDEDDAALDGAENAA